MIEVEIQNETHQSQHTLRFSAVPRIGEGIRLREPDGCWASYDVIDLWYQKAEYGEVWVPYLHVCMTPSEKTAAPMAGPAAEPEMPRFDDVGAERPVYGEEEFVPYTG